MVGHPCKPYIQPNQPLALSKLYSGHSSVSVKAVYDFYNFEKTDTEAMSVYNHISDCTRLWETV